MNRRIFRTAIQATKQGLSSLRRHSGQLASQEGSHSVETALIMPVAMLVLTGLLSFGVYMNNSLQLANSTSLSGQYLALNRGVSDPCNLVITTFLQTAAFLQPSSLTFSFVVNGVSYPSTTGCSGNAANTAKGDLVTITVSYPCSLAVYGANLIPGCTLTSQVTEVMQ